MLAAIAKAAANGDVNDFQPNGESMGSQIKGLIKKGETGQGGGDASVPGWLKAAAPRPLKLSRRSLELVLYFEWFLYKMWTLQH